MVLGSTPSAGTWGLSPKQYPPSNYRALRLWKDLVAPMAEDMIGGMNPADAEMLEEMVKELGRWVRSKVTTPKRMTDPHDR